MGKNAFVISNLIGPSLAFLVALQIAGCGGGGGDSSAANPGSGSGSTNTSDGSGSTGTGSGSGSTGTGSGSGSTGTGSGSGSTGTGSGTGGSSSPTFALNTNSLTFSASNPASPSPSSQNVVGTVTGSMSGTLYILVQSTGAAVSNVSDFTISGSSGQAAVVPAAPAILGAGAFNSTITVRACLNSASCASGELAGSPQTINVTYTVGTTIPADAVMPHVVTTGTAGQVVIRGNGLSGVSAVSFGSMAATAFTVVSNTEVHASYPATLPAQTLPVTLNGGSVSFSGSVVALAPQAYSAQGLALPETPQRIMGTLYDAERRAFFVAAAFTQTADNKLWRYTYSGSGWNATPTIVPVADLRAITFSNDGALLMALTSNSILEFDPANPGTGASRTVPAPFPQPGISAPQYLVTMALANDGYAFIPTGIPGGTGGIGSYLYSTSAHTFTFLPLTMAQFILNVDNYNGSPTLAASADGSLLLATQSALSPPAQVIQYSPETTWVKETQISVNELGNEPPVMDSSATQRIVYDGTANSVYDSNYTLLGKIPGSVRVLTINRQGTRVYALNTDSTLHSYDLTAATVSGNYPEIGSGSTQTVPASNGVFPVRLEISPDGGTLFLTGDTGVAVIPAP